MLLDKLEMMGLLQIENVDERGRGDVLMSSRSRVAGAVLNTDISVSWLVIIRSSPTESLKRKHANTIELTL